MVPDNRTAICPGTFDPVTNGHLDVIARSSKMYDLVIVGVVNLPWRKGSTVFSTEERVGFLRGATKSFPNVEIEPFSNLLVDFARERGAMAIVKGLRAISDFEYELEMNQLNRRQDPEIESVYLMASAKYSFLSSSGIKELATFGGDIEDLVPAEVASALKERLSR
ncbi:MAG TPA: pantetheine-phosphate adenylyltransferase [Solirubrobacteraceae bacterium]|jgi:pantetheine-phosphate adenylyltransferase|nr:pantetheine-phosphate adenylyltransferase [Solirubrobacteraceae bacterium]